MTDDLVSVIMPVYNGAATLREAIDSVVAQTYRPIELIIVNDGSTDGTGEILSQYSRYDVEISDAVADDEIRSRGMAVALITQSNSGTAAARNRGIVEATGRYLAFIDADDIWDPHKLDIQLKHMRKENSIFCFSACKIIDESGNSTGRIRSVPERVDFRALLYDNMIPCLTVVLDRDGLSAMAGSENGRINIEFPPIRHEDYALWLSILHGDLTGGKKVAATGIDRALASYRVAAGSLSGNKLRAAHWHYEVYRKYLKLGIISSIWHFLGYAVRSLAKRI